MPIVLPIFLGHCDHSAMKINEITAKFVFFLEREVLQREKYCNVMSVCMAVGQEQTVSVKK